MKYLLGFTLLLFLSSCGNARTPTNAVQGGIRQLQDKLNDLIGQQWIEATKAFGNTNPEYSKELDKYILNYSSFIITLDKDEIINGWKIKGSNFNEI